MRTRWLVGIVLFVLVVSVGVWGIYRLADPERLELDSAARSSASGQFAALSHGYTHYELGGPENGRVVVLAAGFSVPYYIWDPTFKALVDAGFRVLRYDYYGRGFSDRPATPYTADLHVGQLSELLDALRITGPIDLAGLSFGGSVITSFAYRYPERVRSLVYFDPAFRSPSNRPTFSSMPSVWSFFTAIMDERFWPGQQMGDFFQPERFPDWPARYRVQIQYKGFRRARLAEIVDNANSDQTEEVDRVGEHPRPVLVIWGKEDRTVPIEQSEWLMMKMPHARMVTVESAGHLPQWEQPDVVHAEMLAFLSK